MMKIMRAEQGKPDGRMLDVEDSLNTLASLQRAFPKTPFVNHPWDVTLDTVFPEEISPLDRDWMMNILDGLPSSLDLDLS